MFSVLDEFTPKELIAIGQMAVGYADLDFFITLCAATLLRCRDAEIGWQAIARMDFSGKCERLKELLRHYQTKFNVLPDPAFNELIHAIGRCKSVGGERNQVIHSHIHYDGPSWKPVFRHSRTGGTVDATPEALNTLAIEMSSLAHDCFMAIDGFSYVLERLDVASVDQNG